MRVTCLQMDVQFACVEENFLHAEKLIGDAMKDAPDVIVLPETFTTGFFPRENLAELADRDHIKNNGLLMPGAVRKNPFPVIDDLVKCTVPPA